MEIAEIKKKGSLVYDGHGYIITGSRFSWSSFFKCSDCVTTFPEIDGEIRCNGQHISLCPWCREDSQPWKGGRGL